MSTCRGTDSSSAANAQNIPNSKTKIIQNICMLCNFENETLKIFLQQFFSIQITAQERLRVRERERERVGQQVKFIFKRSCSCSLNNTSTYRKRPARDESASERATEAETETHSLASVRHFGRQSVCLCVG